MMSGAFPGIAVAEVVAGFGRSAEEWAQYRDSECAGKIRDWREVIGRAAE
jgi:hypothetical protein